jgi:LDH2 family malate/lactate/ureidoglycolate dehydrogenase
MRGAGTRVHLPGQGAADTREDLLANGIPVGDVLLGQLRELGDRLGVGDRLQDE